MVFITPLQRNIIINSAYNYSDTNPKQNITASGSANAVTFNNSINTDYTPSTYSYAGPGSGSGITNIKANSDTFAFADSNYIVANNNNNNPNTMMTLPVGLDALAFIYNLDFVGNFTAKAGDFTFINNTWQYTQGTGTNSGNDIVNTKVDTKCNDELRVNPLKITPEIIANIYKGSITTWDNVNIASINDITIPINIPVTSTQTGTGYINIFNLLLRDSNNKSSIMHSYRSDSITNTILTTYLSNLLVNSGITVSSSMSTAFGSTLTGIGTSGNTGVLNYINTTKNSFGYILNSVFLNQIDYDPTTYPTQSSSYKLPPARLKNPAGAFVTLNSRSVTKQFLSQTQTIGYYKNNSIAYNSIDYTKVVQGGYPCINIHSIFFYPGNTQISNKKLDVVCFLIYLTQSAKFVRFTGNQTDIKLGQDKVNSSNIYSFPGYYSQQILQKILDEFPDEKTTLLA